MKALKLIDNILSLLNTNTSKGGTLFNIIENNTKYIGLFIEYKIGNLADSDFACFGSACGDGFSKVLKHFEKNKIGKYFNELGVDICPDPPKPNQNARCFVGYFVKNEFKNIDIKKYETDKIKIKILSPSKWFVYRYIGSYDGLPNAWKNAIKQFELRGYKVYGYDCFFEQYMDGENCSNLNPNDLVTDIYIGI